MTLCWAVAGSGDDGRDAEKEGLLECSPFEESTQLTLHHRACATSYLYPIPDRTNGILLVCNQLYYPASCDPKGHDSSSTAVLGQRAVTFTLFFFPRIPQQPTGYHAVLVALPLLLLLSPPEKRNKRERRRKKTFYPARAWAHCSSIPQASSDADSNSVSASLSSPLQPPGPPKACLPVSRVPLRLALYVVLKATSAQDFGLAARSLVPIHLSLGGACCN